MKKLLCSLLAVAMLLALCACSGGGKTEATHNDAGYYAIFSITEDGETLNQSDLQAVDWNIYLELNEDGTGVLDMGDGPTELTWSDGSLTAGGETVSYVLAGGMLTLDLSDDSSAFVMIFQKGAAPAEDTSAGGTFARPSAPETPAPEEPAAPEEPEEEPAAPEEPEAASEPAEPTEGAPLEAFEPVGGVVGDDYYVEIIGAEAFTDTDGKDGIRFYYDFTNNSDEITYAYSPLYFSAEQEGYTLVTTYASYEDDVPEYGNEWLDLQPGCTIRCVSEYNFKPSGGELSFNISGWDDDGVTATFDAASLPGRPLEREIELIDTPSFFADYADVASTDNVDVEIVSAEAVASAFSDAYCLRVYFTVTNKTDEAQSPLWLLTDSVYQDGIELSSGTPMESVEEDDLYYEDLEPGASVTFAETWEMRTESPIEVVTVDYRAYDNEPIAACVFSFDYSE